MAAVEERERPPGRFAPRPKPLEPWVIVAQDGADDDGGTLYTLFDENGGVVTAAAWPHPLEEWALKAGRATVRGTSWTGATVEIPIGTKRRRRKMEEHELDELDRELDELEKDDDDLAEPDETPVVETEESTETLESALVAVVVADACKIPGCTNRFVQRLGPYGRLCAAHARERKESEQARRNGTPKPAPEQATVRQIEDVPEDVIGHELVVVAEQVAAAQLAIEDAQRALAVELEKLEALVRQLRAS
jgi:hypothetical protein